MSSGKPPATPPKFASRVRFTVPTADSAAIAATLGPALKAEGLFVRHDRPPAPHSMVLVEFALPDGRPVSRITARVKHSRPATTPGERTAGMELEFVDLDDMARAALASAKDLATEAEALEAPGGVFKSLSAALPPRPPAAPDAPIIGIDLGTVNSCVSVVQNGVPRIIASGEGYETVPSVVFVGTDGTVTVGHRAVEKMILQPHRALYGSKRFLGRPYTSKEVRSLGHFFNYELVPGPDGRTAARLGDTILALEDVSAQILYSLKVMASQALKQEVNRAVITVPAYFGETQRQAVRDAAMLAGLQVERLVNEPTAAAIAYGQGRGVKRTVLIYDLGGGTFDLSLLRIDGNKFEVLASDGDPFLGGSDFDDRLTEYALSTFERTHKVALRHDAIAVQRVRFAARLAKHQLSDAEVAKIEVPYVAKVGGSMVDLKVDLDRRLLEALTQDLVDRTQAIINAVLSGVGMQSSNLDEVLFVGGQSRSPHVRQLLVSRFNRKPSAAVHPDHAVAMGAALVAAALQEPKQAVHLVDILPASVRVGMPDGQAAVLLPRGNKLPASKTFGVANTGAAVKISLYRGEGRLATENSFLGVLHLPAKPRPPDGAPAKLQVTVNINAEGLLSATLLDPVTKTPQEMNISLMES